jgi:excisionase family DNA binding protein
MAFGSRKGPEYIVAIRSQSVRRRPDGTPWPDYLTSAEAAAYMSVSLRWLARARSERRIPYHRFGRDARFARADLDAFIAKTRIEAIQ